MSDDARKLGDDQPHQPAEDPKKAAPTTGRRFSFWRLFGICFLALLALLIVLPWVLGSTSLRNRVLNIALADAKLEGSAGGAEFGWLSPLTLTDLKINRPDGKFSVHMTRFQAEHPWWRLLLTSPDLGHLEIDRPHVELLLEQDGKPAIPDSKDQAPQEKRPTLSAIVSNARVIVRTEGVEQPLIDIADLNLDMRIVRFKHGRELIIEPQTVLDHQSLSPELCKHGIQLIAPVLADTATVDGSVSFTVDKFRLPLDDADQQRRAENTEISGKLQLHDVVAGVKTPLMREVAGMASQFLGRNVPTRTEITEETAVQFHIKEGRVFHSGLSFMLPELAPDLILTSEGSVGFDESLDLQLQVPLPLTMLRDGPLLRRLSERPLDLRVVGTLNEPKIQLPEDRNWLTEVVNRLAGDDSPVRQATFEEPVDPVGERPAVTTVDPTRAPASNNGNANNRPSDQPRGDVGNSAGDRVAPLLPLPADLDSPEAVVNTVGDLIEVLREARQANQENPQDGAPAPTPLLDRIRERRQQRVGPAPAQDTDEPTQPRRKLFNRRKPTSREL